MTNFKKLIGIISKILFALLLTLTLVNVTSCEIMEFLGGSQGNSPGTDQQGNPNDEFPQLPEPTAPPKNHYSDYENFNTADYVIEDESGKPDSEIELTHMVSVTVFSKCYLTMPTIEIA